jgi:hypothetical protein
MRPALAVRILRWVRRSVVVVLALAHAAPAMAADLSGLQAGQRTTIAYPQFGAPLVGGVAQVVIGLPAHFDPAKTYGIYLWYNGGNGGSGIDDTFSFRDRQICLSLPLFRRGANDPKPADLAGESEVHPGDTHLEELDWYKNWLALETVLVDLRSVAPHIDPALSYCGGYSNGGHVIGFMAAHCPAFCSQFKGYLFIEGGYDGFHELSTVKYLRGADHAVYAVGGEKSSASSIKAGIYEACLAAQIDATFLFEPGIGHAYDPKYTPDTRAWIEAHIFTPGLSDAMQALDEAVAHKRWAEAMRAYRAASQLASGASQPPPALAGDLATLDAAAAPALGRVDLAKASASELKHLLTLWAPCPASAAAAAQFGQLADQALAKLPPGDGHEALGELRRFIKTWPDTPAAEQARQRLERIAEADLGKAEALPSGPKRVTTLLAVEKAWKDVPAAATARDEATAELRRLLRAAQAVADPRTRYLQELKISSFLPEDVICETALDDSELLLRQAAN